MNLGGLSPERQSPAPKIEISSVEFFVGVGLKVHEFQVEAGTFGVSRGRYFMGATVQVRSVGVRWGSMRDTRGVPPEVIASPPETVLQ